MPNDRLAVGRNASTKLKSNVKEKKNNELTNLEKVPFKENIRIRLGYFLDLRLCVSWYRSRPVSSETTKKRCES